MLALRSEDSTAAASAAEFIAEAALLDTDIAYESGLRGIHAILCRLSASLEPLVADAAANAICACTSALLPLNKGFPLSAVSVNFLPELRPPPVSSIGLHSFLDAPSVDASYGGALHRYSWRPRSLLTPRLPPSELRLLTRLVPPHVHRQRSQDDVGQVCWPAAPVLARWAVAHRALLAEKSTLELGAGLGLSGIAAGFAASLDEAAAATVAIAAHGEYQQLERRTRCCLSDFNEIVLQNLEFNVRLSEPSLNPAELPVSGALLKQCDHTRPLFSVRKHDWSKLNEPEEGGIRSTSASFMVDLPSDAVFDCILGSDMICSDDDVIGVVASLRRYLRRPTEGASAASQAMLRSSSYSTVDLFEAAITADGGSSIANLHASLSMASFGLSLSEEAGCALHLQRRSLASSPQIPLLLDSDAAAGSTNNSETALSLYGGFAVFIVPPPFTRWGVDKLAPALHRAGFQFCVQRVHPAFLDARYGGRDDDAGVDTLNVTAGGLESQLEQWFITWRAAASAAV